FLHGVDHLRRDQHRHGGALADVALDALRQIVGQMVAERLLELRQVLDRVLALPERAFPFLPRDPPVAGQPGPVGLRVGALERVPEGLIAGLSLLPRCHRAQARPPLAWSNFCLARRSRRARGRTQATLPAPCSASASAPSPSASRRPSSWPRSSSVSPS